MTALAFRSVALRYADGTLALEHLDLGVQPGEFLSVLGPSGCGKSSLLRIASGLTPHTAGEIVVDRAQLGLTFQDPTLLPWRTVRANAELLLELRGVAATERHAIAQQKLALVGLQGFESHYPRQLSGGMRMRASLARSLTLDPALVMFDEPFGALDEISRERLNDELMALYRSQGFTAVFVTHSIAEAVFLATRVVVMSARPGRIVAEFTVPFAYPRVRELRYAPEFTTLCGRVSAALRSVAAGAGPRAGAAAGDGAAS